MCRLLGFKFCITKYYPYLTVLWSVCVHVCVCVYICACMHAWCLCVVLLNVFSPYLAEIYVQRENIPNSKVWVDFCFRFYQL